MATMAGNFVWYELMTTDMDAAEAFYRSAVGWDARDSGQPAMRYTLFTVGETRIAGMMAIPPDAAAMGMQPGWIGYIGTANVDEAAARVEKTGGKIHKAPADIPHVGRFAMVADQQGAMFALFQPGPGEPPPPPAPGAPGTAGWNELMTTDWERAFAFYAAEFGWTKGDAIDMGPMGTYQLFAAGAYPVGGMMNDPGGARPSWRYYFNVADIEAAAARVREGGGEVLMGPHPVPGGSIIVNCRDPQGAAFSLVQPAPM